MKVVEIVLNYVPRKWQAKAHCFLKRHNILVFHRRGGKTVFCTNELKDKSLNFNKKDPKTGNHFRDPKYAYVAPTIGQVEKIAWGYFKEYLGQIPGVKFNESKLRVTYPHPYGTCTIYLFGAENFETFRGLYLDGYVLDEFSDMHPDVRDKVLLPTLSDRKGWEIIIGTPKGDDNFKKLYEIARSDPDDWYSCLFKASETGIIDEDELKMLKKTMSPEAYAQEYECDFYAIPSGYYYQKQMEVLRNNGQIINVPYDPMSSVSTFWDLGYNDSGTIWFIQEIGREIRVLRYIQNSGVGLEWYVQQINELREKYNYIYGPHYLPHDVEHHEISTGRTRREYLESLGLRDIITVPRSVNVSEDIHAVRNILPMCYFDKVHCVEGIECLRQYKRKWDSKKRVFLNTPMHDEYSHGADGFRQFAVSYEPGFSKPSSERYEELPSEVDCEYDIFEV